MHQLGLPPPHGRSWGALPWWLLGLTPQWTQKCASGYCRGTLAGRWGMRLKAVGISDPPRNKPSDLFLSARAITHPERVCDALADPRCSLGNRPGDLGSSSSRIAKAPQQRDLALQSSDRMGRWHLSCCRSTVVIVPISLISAFLWVNKKHRTAVQTREKRRKRHSWAL